MAHSHDPARSLIVSVLAYQDAASRGGWLAGIARKYASLRHHFWSIVTASDIDRDASIPADLKLPHPVGVVIHRDAVIGPGCMIMQQVTIGQLADGAAPRIGTGSARACMSARGPRSSAESASATMRGSVPMPWS